MRLKSFSLSFVSFFVSVLGLSSCGKDLSPLVSPPQAETPVVDQWATPELVIVRAGRDPIKPNAFIGQDVFTSDHLGFRFQPAELNASVKEIKVKSECQIGEEVFSIEANYPSQTQMEIEDLMAPEALLAASKTDKQELECSFQISLFNTHGSERFYVMNKTLIRIDPNYAELILQGPVGNRSEWTSLYSKNIKIAQLYLWCNQYRTAWESVIFGSSALGELLSGILEIAESQGEYPRYLKCRAAARDILPNPTNEVSAEFDIDLGPLRLEATEEQLIPSVEDNRVRLRNITIKNPSRYPLKVKLPADSARSLTLQRGYTGGANDTYDYLIEPHQKPFEFIDLESNAPISELDLAPGQLKKLKLVGNITSKCPEMVEQVIELGDPSRGIPLRRHQFTIGPYLGFLLSTSKTVELQIEISSGTETEKINLGNLMFIQPVWVPAPNKQRLPSHKNWGHLDSPKVSCD